MRQPALDAQVLAQACQALGADGVAVFPADEEFTPLWRTLAGDRRVLTFALGDVAADVTATASWSADH